METKNYQILNDSLKSLGIKGNVKCIPVEHLRDRIMLNGEYFGIWDYQRNTFVD